MNVNLDDYDVRHKKTKGIRLRIPRDVFISMMLALSHCIEKYEGKIGELYHLLPPGKAEDDNKVIELKQAKESAKNLRIEIFDKLDCFLYLMESGDHYGANYSDRYLTEIPDLERDIEWACGSDKLLVDIIKFALKCPIAVDDIGELTDWAHEIKTGEHKF